MQSLRDQTVRSTCTDTAQGHAELAKIPDARRTEVFTTA